MKIKSLATALLALALMPLASRADDTVALTFSRSGTAASSVTVSTSGLSGCTASLTSTSHTFMATKGNVNSTILCPNVNGNTSPTITLTFSVSGLPADKTVSAVGLELHALNSEGVYQDPTDGKSRQWNIAVSSGTTSLGSRYNIDIAKNVGHSGAVHQEWEFTPAAGATLTNPATITVQISKGSSNEGCFIGISSLKLTLSSEGGSEIVDPQPEGDTYYIQWKNNTTEYIMESGSNFVVGQVSDTSPCFWQLIPTGRGDNYYYLRNVATGHYIGSCNMEPSSSSVVPVSLTPVEYYMGTTSSTNSEIAGCVWFSSTDCSGYSAENGARALNKDGASSNIITWQNNATGTSRPGSYWKLVPTTHVYEVKFFQAVASVGAATSFYNILSPAGKSLTKAGTWATRTSDDDQKWYFVGTSNAAGGYQIVSGQDNTVAFGGKKYTTAPAESNNAYFTLTDADGNMLSIDGVTEFQVLAVRSAMATSLQIYNMPCGVPGSIYFSKVSVEAENTLHYPLPQYSTTAGLTQPSASSTTGYYAMLSSDKAIVTDEDFTINVGLNANPADGTAVYAYFDWDRDGVFETVHQLPATRTSSTTISVPADIASIGQSRMRLRVTTNGLSDAEADVAGQALDLFVNYVGPMAQDINPTVKPNDPQRGTATYNKTTHVAKATALGDATFLYWKEGTQVLSTGASTTIEPSKVARSYVAVFSPNLDNTVLGIDPSLLDKTDGQIVIAQQDRTLEVQSASAVKLIMVFALNGNLAATARDCNTMQLDDLTQGLYIVKAVSETGTATSKIIIR